MLDFFSLKPSICLIGQMNLVLIAVMLCSQKQGWWRSKIHKLLILAITSEQQGSNRQLVSSFFKRKTCSSSVSVLLSPYLPRSRSDHHLWSDTYTLPSSGKVLFTTRNWYLLGSMKSDPKIWSNSRIKRRTSIRPLGFGVMACTIHTEVTWYVGPFKASFL